ncbi:uncharacterized protein LOC110456147 [Mizuhopecten yessoensis]|uniref:EF-hand domain-containing protein n=1 Tax=Mizuhopecten yessoensis TaxID=6573 RepID=A0A210QBM9_MIZYE|nr:uncharacterized protein LOC110456147 [Mizuhopecten yessoensis]OWF46132.1 hypothetical protein KP79_PYT04329 [Mizuhopecten yessoensis]
MTIRMHVFTGIIFLLGLSASFAAVTNTRVVDTSHAGILAAVDTIFRANDLNNNSKMELGELVASYALIDYNNDDRISKGEYVASGGNNPFFGVLFQELDNDGDGYLDRSAILGEYTVMDTNADNEVSRREYDNYFDKIVESALMNYGHLLG